MRILYVINSLDGGGGALPLPHVIGVMQEAGHEVHVVSLMERDGRARSLLESANIKYMVIGSPRRRYLRTAWRLDRIVRTMRPDLIWTSLTHATVSGQLIGRLYGLPVVSWLHNAWLRPANIWLLRRTGFLSHYWVADSITVKTFGVETLGLDPTYIAVWPLFMTDPHMPSARPWSTGMFRLGSLGRLHPNKGYDVLIRAIAQMQRESPAASRSLSVHIAGEGPERAALEGLARELDVRNVAFEGFTDQPSAFLSTLHGYVQPSHHEGLCIAVHQAMGAGLPIVASAVGEMQQSVSESGGGFLVDYGDVDQLAAALTAMVTRPDQSAAMGSAARTWVHSRYSEANFRTTGLAALKEAQVRCRER